MCSVGHKSVLPNRNRQMTYMHRGNCRSSVCRSKGGRPEVVQVVCLVRVVQVVQVVQGVKVAQVVQGVSVVQVVSVVLVAVWPVLICAV